MRKSDALAQILRQKILVLPTNWRLPSVRSLMQRYNLSLQTVNTALRQLEGEGLVARRRGSGTYTQRNQNVPYIELHLPRYRTGNLEMKEQSVGEAVANAGWSLSVRYHHPSLDDPMDTSDPGASAHVILAELIRGQRTFFNLLRRTRSVLVLLGREIADDMDMITVNDHQVLLMLARHLTQLGHRHFAFLANEPPSSDMHLRRSTFGEVLSLLGVPPPIYIDCGTPMGDLSSVGAYEAMAAFLGGLKGQALPFTALVTATPPGTLGGIRAMHEAGLSVPRDCSVATFGISPENALYLPAVTDAGTPASAWGDAVVDILRRRFGGETAGTIHIELPSLFNLRETTGAAARTEVIIGRD